ncbi:DUF2510 domain-containing protein [Microbacterium marinilacus]|uniref:DUF2510 domain-containing protein n=1 Tax=Microbacterium marinilacus TaxID=415209 RepID=A0ABP7BK26_9MICO|nr:DUF2510 domain-containing protein [Microbacterium marinilacus]
MNGSSFVRIATARPAGWYDDPKSNGGKRWFDGERWTELVRAPKPAKARRGCTCDC